MKNDLGAPHNTLVIVERGSEMAIGHYTNGMWLIGSPSSSLKEPLDFVPTKWRHTVK